MPRTETLIIGAGQAGLALSLHLQRAGHDHVLLERGRVGERWRSERWESLTLLTPNWLNRLPGSRPHAEPDGFLSRVAFVEYLDRYARSIDAPIREGVTVRSVRSGGAGFVADSDRGTWQATSVVIATGDCDVPAVPPAATAVPAGVLQLHSNGYQSPGRLTEGGVLVVGAGPSGQQIALELVRSGRHVVLSVGRHARFVRRFRGRDIFRWLDEFGELDRTTDQVADLTAARLTPNIPVTGSNGGEQIDLHVLGEAGVVLAGRLEGFAAGRALFAADLHENVARAEDRMRRVLANIDEYAARRSDTAVPEAEPIRAVSLPDGPAAIDLEAAGISTVIWATGYRRAYPWLHVPALDADGELLHSGGVACVPGLYALGLRFQRARKSHIIGGVGEDAEVIARHILHAKTRGGRPSTEARKISGLATEAGRRSPRAGGSRCAEADRAVCGIDRADDSGATRWADVHSRPRVEMV